MSRACREAGSWTGDFSLAFNIAPSQLVNVDFPERFCALISTTGFPLSRIEVEITEASLISDVERSYKTLEVLNGLGVKIAIDDFGTGYSSLARLEAFPFHKLKIDARFVHGLDGDSGKRRIAASTIGLGQSLGMIVVAEGVETPAEHTILRDLGCDLGQGWHFSKPLQASHADPFLKRQGSSRASSKPLDASPFQQLHQLASLYDNAPVGLCFVDLHFRHVRANDRFANIHGMTGTELRGSTIYETMEGEALEAVVDLLTRTATTDEPQILDYVFCGRDCRFIVSRVLDLGGDVIGFSVVAIDVTDENRLKATLVESEQRLRQELDFSDAIITSLPGLFYYHDADLKLRRFNRNVLTISGYTSEELLEKGALDFFTGDDKQAAASSIEMVFSQGHAQLEADYLTADGRSIPYLFTGVRLETNQRPGFVGVGTDISELRRAQQDLRERNAFLDAVFHTTLDGILLVDPKGTSLLNNDRFTTICRLPEDLIASRDGRAQLAYIAGLLKNRHTFDETLAALDADPDAVAAIMIEFENGTLLKLHSAPICDKQGNHLGRAWVIRDGVSDCRHLASI